MHHQQASRLLVARRFSLVWVFFFVELIAFHQTRQHWTRPLRASAAARTDELERRGIGVSPMRRRSPLGSNQHGFEVPARGDCRADGERDAFR